MVANRIHKRSSSANGFKIQIGILVLALVCMSSGCRNCGNPCGGYAPYPGGCQNGGCGNTIPPAPTYSLPGLSQNQPYYNNGTATARQPGYLVNPGGVAPTPAVNGPSLAPSGWRPSGANGVGNNGSNFSQTGHAPDTQFTIQAPTSAATVPGHSVLVQPASTPVNRTASATNGISYKDSVNYSTTSIDERRDDTRLPATNASTVRAPTAYSNVQVAANPYTNNQFYNGQAYGGQSRYASNTGPGFSNNQIVNGQLAGPRLINGIVQYAQPGNPNTGYQSGTYPTQTQSAPALLAQSTSTYDPRNNPNYNSGWRDRDLK